jgi:adenosylcobinamide-GDP ribazoletransferase
VTILTALAFLTRIPVGRSASFEADDVARSAGWFPLIGVLLGATYAAAAAVLKPHLPATAVAILLVAMDALLTGALHFDGLADSADGFGGGRDRDGILRIMRDHAIGSYGGVALAILVVLKVAALSTLLGIPNTHDWIVAIIITPVLGRWSMLLLTAALPYARETASPATGMGKGSLVWGTVTTVIALAVTMSARAWIAAGVVATVTAGFGAYSRKKIGGVTGDVLGANLQICECAALLTFLWTGAAQ